MSRLPNVGSDLFVWGGILNDYLSVEHDSTGSHFLRVSDSSNAIDGSANGGDICFWDSGSSSYKPALASDPAKFRAMGMRHYVNPQTGPSTIVVFGRCDTTAVLTPGSKYYLSDSLAGAITATPPTTDIIFVGQALTSSTIFIDINRAFPDTSVSAPSRYLIKTEPSGYVKKIYCDDAGLLHTTD
jgi:hypothetical protein